MGHAGFGEARGEDVQGIVEGAKDDGLFATGEALLDELEGAVQFGDVGVAGARFAGGLEIVIGSDEEFTGRVGGGDAEGLQLRADGRAAVFVEVLGVEMELVHGGLFPAHGGADDVPGFGDDVFPEVGFAAAEDDGGEHFPEPMDIADLRGEFFEAARLLAFAFLGEVAFADEEGAGELFAGGGFIGIGEAGMRFGPRAGGPPSQPEYVREAIFNGCGGEDELVFGVDLADAGADDGVFAFHFHAFVNGAGGEGVLAEIGERRAVNTFDFVRFATPFALANAGGVFLVHGGGHLAADDGFLGGRQVAEAGVVGIAMERFEDVEAAFEFAFEGVVVGVFHEGLVEAGPKFRQGHGGHGDEALVMALE